MSNIIKDGKIINAPGHGTTDGTGKSRYKDAEGVVIDWWDTHVKPAEAKVEEKAKEVVAAVDADVHRTVLFTEKEIENFVHVLAPAPRVLSAPPITYTSVESITGGKPGSL